MNSEIKEQLLDQLNEALSGITLSIKRGPMQLTHSKLKAIESQGKIKEAIETLSAL